MSMTKEEVQSIIAEAMSAKSAELIAGVQNHTATQNKALEEALLGKFQEMIAGIPSPAPAPAPAASGDSAENIDTSLQATRIKELESRLAAAEKSTQDERQRLAELAEKQRVSNKRVAIERELLSMGVPAHLHEYATPKLMEMVKENPQVPGDYTLALDDQRDDFGNVPTHPLAHGVKAWAMSRSGKAFLPSSGAPAGPSHVPNNQTRSVPAAAHQGAAMGVDPVREALGNLLTR